MPASIASDALPSRLIPGALEYPNPVPRKKAASIAMGRTLLSLEIPRTGVRELGSWVTSFSPRRVRNVLIIGAGPVGRQLACSLDADESARSAVLGFLDEHAPIGGAVLGRIADLASIARREFVEEIILTAPLHRDAVQKAIQEARANQIDVRLVPDFFG